jgi:AraC-like DNA-binding protein
MMLRESQYGMPKQIELAALLAISSRTFARLLAEEGACFRDLLMQARLERARTEIGTTPNSIAQIAWQLGYRDVANFSRAFRRGEGCAPRAFRRRPRGADQ